MKKWQIGVMGSAEDLKYSDEALSCAKELGRLIALSGNILVYGAEKEYSLCQLMQRWNAVKMAELLLE